MDDDVPYGGNIIAGGLDIDPMSTAGDLYAAPQWRGLYKSADAGTSWASIVDHVDSLPFDRTNIADVALGPTGVLYVAASGGISRSFDRGGTWTSLNTGIPYYIRRVVPFTSSVIYAGSDLGGVYRSLDGGSSWTAVNGVLPANSSIRALAVVPGATDVMIYAGTESSGLFRSINGGNTWAALGNSTLTRVDAIAVGL